MMSRNEKESLKRATSKKLTEGEDEISKMIARINSLLEKSDEEAKQKKMNGKRSTVKNSAILRSSQREQERNKDFDFSQLLIKVPPRQNRKKGGCDDVVRRSQQKGTN